MNRLQRPHHLLVVDLETVPDRAVLTDAQNTHPEYFPRPIQHQIVCAGVLRAKTIPLGQGYYYGVEKLAAPTVDEYPERELVAGFWTLIERQRPRVVGWNSRGFDIPVLKGRAMVYGLSAPAWYQADPRWGYDYRFQREYHVDAMDGFSNYDAATPSGLEATAIAMGFPGKIGAHGSEIETMLGEGRFAEISAYCTGDVLLTYLLFLRFAYFSGELSAEAHNRSVRQLVEFLEGETVKRPFLGEFLEIWQASARPCPMVVEEPGGGDESLPPESHLPSEHVE